MTTFFRLLLSLICLALTAYGLYSSYSVKKKKKANLITKEEAIKRYKISLFCTVFPFVAFWLTGMFG